MNCSGCQAALQSAWKLCPFCGVPIPRAIRTASAAQVWELWKRYHGFVRDSLLPFLRTFAAVQDETLEVKVEAMTPQRYVDALANTMRRLSELAEDTRLPPEFRRALTELGHLREHEAHIGQSLAPAIAALQAAIQALIEAGDIKGGALDQIGAFLERRDRANTFEQIGSALSGIDGGLIRFASMGLSSLIDSSRASARQERWGAACLAFAEAVDKLIERAWDHLARQTQLNGLALREASELRATATEADARWLELVEAQERQDGSFEQVLTRVHALARAQGDALPVQQLRTHAELLAEVRGELVGHWVSRLNMGITQDALTRAQQHFLRLLPGDGVLAFFATTVFGQGKAGLALTTSSVQWLDENEQVYRIGYADLRSQAIEWTDEHVLIGSARVGKLTEFETQPAARALQACVRLSVVAPGPGVCACGAPGHWLRFGDDEARCPGCGGAVNYA